MKCRIPEWQVKRSLLAVAGANEAGGAGAQIVPLVDFNDLSLVSGKSRTLSEGLRGRVFLTAYTRFADAERERLSKGSARGQGSRSSQSR